MDVRFTNFGTEYRTGVIWLLQQQRRREGTPAPAEGNDPPTEAAAQDTMIMGRGGDSVALDPSIVTDGESSRSGIRYLIRSLIIKRVELKWFRRWPRAGKFPRTG